MVVLLQIVSLGYINKNNQLIKFETNNDIMLTFEFVVKWAIDRCAIDCFRFTRSEENDIVVDIHNIELFCLHCWFLWFVFRAVFVLLRRLFTKQHTIKNTQKKTCCWCFHTLRHHHLRHLRHQSTSQIPIPIRIRHLRHLLRW